MVTYIPTKIVDAKLLYDSRNKLGRPERETRPRWLMVEVVLESVNKDKKHRQKEVFIGQEVDTLLSQVIGKHIQYDFCLSTLRELKGKSCILCRHVKGHKVGVLNADEVQIKE